jgi:hypothetical protein
VRWIRSKDYSPVSVLYTDEIRPEPSDHVFIRWGEHRGSTGMVIAPMSNSSCELTIFGSSSPTPHVLRNDALRLMIEEIEFNSKLEAELWLAQSDVNDQKFAIGATVQVSELNNRRHNPRNAIVVRYLGIRGDEPPSYLVQLGEDFKLVPEYFLFAHPKES